MRTILIILHDCSVTPAQVRIKGQMKAKEGMEIVDEMERRLGMLYSPPTP